MKPILEVQHIRKKFSRNSNAHLSYGIRDLFQEILGRTDNGELREDEFWAVDDVSFHLYPGDSIALIGRNGSGKSTLLKMINGLIKPDGGRIEVHGAIQALINLGAGFNFSLSGRDNIYTSAALMGLTRKETEEQMESIIEFSEIEEFIDSPVGNYSSGMKARLGFSVAINLRPQILLIDEILSVGDAAFQNKCFVKMHELKKSGVTIVLVTHSYTHVVQICEQAIWLHKGKVMRFGPSKETVQAYLDFLSEEQVDRVTKLNQLKSDNQQSMEKKRTAEVNLFGAIYNDFDRIDEVEVELLVDGVPVDSFPTHSSVEIHYRFHIVDRVTDLNVSLVFCTPDGKAVSAISTLNGDLLKSVHDGVVDCSVTIPDFNLCPGEYVLLMPVHEGKSYLYRDKVKEFVVTGPGRLTWHLLDFQYDYQVRCEKLA
ncbi:MAG: ABC transporter ATP-binding protein [Candidatus Omnitrophica bacterium]|nr:ABC transporter ATP-binding protein [Candidatus Omnitrophota bacterium]MCB9768988.1 ABC transporter ATP-binding protein [Candidatus Omnitrophota bacterium]MCB9782412.1 ABC transporter ATP-binding protein [Candidatus Omnitrophota bacterium]